MKLVQGERVIFNRLNRGVSRKLALKIAVVCMALLIVLSGVLEYQIVNFQSQLSRDKSAIDSSNTKVAAMNSTITNLNSQLSLDPNRIVDGFSIVQITDTQYLSDTHPDLFSGLTSWIADKASALNLTMVVHTGDIVQVPALLRIGKTQATP